MNHRSSRSRLAAAFTVVLAGLLSHCLVGSFTPHAHAEASTDGPGFAPWTGDFDGMEKRRLIRILVPYSKTIYFIDLGQQLGTGVEFGNALGEWLNAELNKKKQNEKINVAFIPVARGELLQALVDGRGDLVYADLTVTPQRRKTVDFSDPLASGVREVLVTGPAAPAITSLDDLGGKEIRVRRTSSYYEHLSALNTERSSAGKPEIIVREIDENLEDEDILEMVNAGLLPWAIADRFNALIWAEVFDDLTVHEDVVVSEGGEIAFAIRKGSPQLKEKLAGFIRQHKIGTSFGNILKKRYYQNDRMVRRAYAPSDLAKFQALLLLFRSYGGKYAFDPLLLAAQGFQESQLDQGKRSPRGAVGIMQLLPSTAAGSEVGIAGVADSAERNIEAGAKYLRHLSETYITDAGPKPLDRMLLTLAAYNAGPGNLRRFRHAAGEMGLSPDIWFGNVENGAARIVGRETVQYVSNIYKYYIAYSMYAEQLRMRDETVGSTTGQSATGN